VGENMWLYIPNVGKPIRITSLQSVIAGFSTTRTSAEPGLRREYNVEKLERRKRSFSLHLRAKNKTVAYDQLRCGRQGQEGSR